MKNVLTVLFMMILGVCPVFAQWVNVQDIKDPIRLLDTDNIYKIRYNNIEGAGFRIRYTGKDKKDNVATFFADFENNKAGVISISQYAAGLPNFYIPKDFKMKDISEFKTNFSKIKEYANKKYLNECPEEFLIKPLSMEEKGLVKSYLGNIEKDISKNWNMPKNDEENHTLIRLKINKDGNIETHKMILTSQNEMFNQTALRALKLTEPFKAFPKKYTRDYMWLDFAFGYNNMNEESQRDILSQRADSFANVLTGILLIPLIILGL